MWKMILIVYWVLCLFYTLGVGIKLTFLFKNWNVTFVNVFLLRFITSPIGWDWYLVVFSTISNVYKYFHGFLKMVYCLFHLHWSCVLGVVLPVKVVLFVLVILLDFDLLMKLILIVVFPCYLCLKLGVVLM